MGGVGAGGSGVGNGGVVGGIEAAMRATGGMGGSASDVVVVEDLHLGNPGEFSAALLG
jgi:hypothetical protein